MYTIYRGCEDSAKNGEKGREKETHGAVEERDKKFKKGVDKRGKI